MADDTWDGRHGGRIPARGDPVPCVTVPSDDATFREHVRRLAERFPDGGPMALQERLARLFPRVVVRARGLSGEPDVWYVYRDGSWRAPSAPWWDAAMVPHVVLSDDGWVIRANTMARSLLGFGDDEPHHYSDFVAPGTTDAASMLFQIVMEVGHPLSGTLVLRPIGGELIACEVRAERVPEGLEGWLRLADDVELGPWPGPVTRPDLRTEPAADLVFGAYAERQLAAMSDPSVEGLGLRLRRLFPHARVAIAGPARWVAERDGDGRPADASAWWADGRLPRVRFDDRGLILEANEAATTMLGEDLVGRHWHDLATPGSQDQVQPVLDMLRAAGEVASRFRLPAGDGRLVEFDSHTRVEGEDFVTTMRPSGCGDHG